MLRKMKDDWPRYEHFRHYTNTVRCSYSLTVHVDITHLRARLKALGLKAYPAQIYLLARAVNHHAECRMGVLPDGSAGVWDVVHPAYALYHERSRTFSSVWTKYDPCFSRFYAAVRGDMERFAGAAQLFPQGDIPPNVFDVSSIPWVDFTAFNLNVDAGAAHLAPIFTIGGYGEEGGRTLMPLAVQLHHAACDGVHAGELVHTVRQLAQGCDEWL